MPDSLASPEPPSDAEAARGVAPAVARQSRYPRPWWLASVRFLLLIAGVIAGPLYVWALVQALIHHTLPTRDRDLLSVPTIVAAVLLTAGGLWAIRDTAREWIAADRQRTAERRVPLAVRAEQRWRADLARQALAL